MEIYNCNLSWTLSKLPSLNTLELDFCGVTKPSDSPAEWTLFKNVTVEGLRTLRMAGLPTRKMFKHIVQHCPNLETLDWSVPWSRSADLHESLRKEYDTGIVEYLRVSVLPVLKEMKIKCPRMKSLPVIHVEGKWAGEGMRSGKGFSKKTHVQAFLELLRTWPTLETAALDIGAVSNRYIDMIYAFEKSPGQFNGKLVVEAREDNEYNPIFGQEEYELPLYQDSDDEYHEGYPQMILLDSARVHFKIEPNAVYNLH